MTSIRVIQYRGKKFRGDGTILADSDPIVSGLCGSMSICIYGKENHPSHKVRLTMSIDDADTLANKILSEVTRQRALSAKDSI